MTEKNISKEIDRVLHDAREAMKVSQKIVDKLEACPSRPDNEYFQHELYGVDNARVAADQTIDILTDISRDLDKTIKTMQIAIDKVQVENEIAMREGRFNVRPE